MACEPHVTCNVFQDALALIDAAAAHEGQIMLNDVRCTKHIGDGSITLIPHYLKRPGRGQMFQAACASGGIAVITCDWPDGLDAVIVGHVRRFRGAEHLLVCAATALIRYATQCAHHGEITRCLGIDETGERTIRRVVRDDVTAVYVHRWVQGAWTETAVPLVVAANMPPQPEHADGRAIEDADFLQRRVERTLVGYLHGL